MESLRRVVPQSDNVAEVDLALNGLQRALSIGNIELCFNFMTVLKKTFPLSQKRDMISTESRWRPLERQLFYPEEPSVLPKEPQN